VLINCQAWRTAFDHQVRLTLIGQGLEQEDSVESELVLETPFLLRDADGEPHQLQPGTGSHLAPVLDLFMTVITTIEVRDHGTLIIGFDNGSELSVSPNGAYRVGRRADSGPVAAGG
jgi:hypothetical protein